jgi:tRNA (guanine37-N1)-methyltransferase
MNFTILTLFPEMFSTLLVGGILKRSVERECISIHPVDIRNFATDRHGTVDDRPYGGGCGMVMKAEPLTRAIRHVKEEQPEAHTLLLTPQGRLLNHKVAQQLAQAKGLVLVCGRYEGVDARICEGGLIDGEISIGDFVLTGGELAAMVVIEVVSRFVPGVLGNRASASEDSFSEGFLEHAQYTRPRSFEGTEVPQVLISGNHQAIDKWRREAAVMRTLLRRPELLLESPLTSEDMELLKRLQKDIEAIIQRHASRS